MKRIISIAAALLILLSCVVPVYAEGVNVLSDNGDRVSLFNDAKIDKPVNGNVVAVFGNVEVDAEVNGLVVSVFGDAKVDSRVSGQVITVMGDAKLGKNAVIQGSLFTLGQLYKEPGAKVLGQEVNIFGRQMKVDVGEFLIIRVLLVLMFSIVVFLVGMLYIAASRKKVGEIEAGIEKDLGRKLLLGLLAYLGATIILVLLFITIIVPVLYFILVVLATAMSSICLGKLITKAMCPSSSVYVKFATGLITLTLLELLLTFLIPGGDIILSLLLIGGFGLLINSFGIGTLFIAKYEKK